MWISFYNKEGVGDVLMFSKGDLPRHLVAWDTVANVTRIYHKETKETYGYNFHHISERLTLSGSGQVKLTQAEMDTLNQIIYEQGFEPIPYSDEPRLVVGEVETCVPHEDSDHLNVTQTRVGEVTYQIVCGASNVHADMRVVVALPGAVMPNGQVIRSGELRGVSSDGMLCSAYELGVDPERLRQGILEIKPEVATGTPFESLTREQFV